MSRTTPLAVLALLLLAALLPAQESRPLPAVELVGTINHVQDGDTVTLLVEIPVVVRLKDCWAHETRTIDRRAKHLGLASKDHLEELALGKRAKLRVEYEPGKGLQQVFSFGRVVGDLTLDDGTDLAAAQVAAGHATKTKPSD